MTKRKLRKAVREERRKQEKLAEALAAARKQEQEQEAVKAKDAAPAPDPRSPMDRLRDAIRMAAQVEAAVASRLVGQPDAIRTLGRLAYEVALDQPRTRPLIATFLGPPATGKTLAATLFADALRGVGMVSPENGGFEIVDAQRYGNRSEDLWGATGRLVRLVSKQPRALILVDEMEKGSHDFLMGFLAALGSGKVIVSGETVDFSKAIFIFSTNLGHELWLKDSPQSVDLFDLLANAKRPNEEKHYWATNAIPREIVSRLSAGEISLFRALEGHHRTAILLDAITGGMIRA